MPFQPKENLPDFAALKVVFINAREQIKDYPLFQTIINFLDASGKSQRLTNDKIEDNSADIVDLSNAQFATVADESVLLQNSRQLLAGTGIAFDDVTDNERTISATAGGVRDAGYWSPLILDGEDNGDSEMIITDTNAPIAIWNPTP